MRNQSLVNVPKRVLVSLELSLHRLDELECGITQAMADDYSLRMNHEATITRQVVSNVRSMFAQGDELDELLREMTVEQIDREVVRMLGKHVVPTLMEVVDKLEELWAVIENDAAVGNRSSDAIIRHMPDRLIARLGAQLVTMVSAEVLDS